MHSNVPFTVLKRLLTQQPHLIMQVFSSLLRKHLTVNYDYYFKKGRSAPFRQLSLKITNKCNLSCKMCAQWGEKGYNFAKPGEVINVELPFKVYENLIDDIKPFNPIFYIWGGEPFLYHSIMDVLWYLKEMQLTTTIVTNGIGLVKNAEELVRMKLDGLLMSLDGPEEVHNKIRGWNKSYQHLMDGVRQVHEYKLKHDSTLPYLVFLITISDRNNYELYNLFKIIEDVGADAVVCYYSWFTNQEIGKQYVEIMQEHFGITPTSWTGYLLPIDKIDTKAIQENVQRIKSKKWKFQYIFLPDLKTEQIPKYYQDASEKFSYKQCVAPWLICEIMPNGDVVTCRDYSDYITGNITKGSILDIWNNERYQLFRNTLKEKGLLPICSRCCGLMGF